MLLDRNMRIEHNNAERNASRGLKLVSCSSARTRPLSELSEEMIMEILLRLPTRTLVSLKSVCTSWRNLISSPDFTRNHFRRSCLRDPSLTPPQIAYYTLDHWCDVIGSFSVQLILNNPSEPTKVTRFSRGDYYIVVGSCHGLLCFFDSDANGDMQVILWNPCTGFIFESPQISGQACFSGFGYDHLSDTYKFYATIRKKVPSGVESSAIIYTFGPTLSWRRLDHDIPSRLLSAREAYHPYKADNKQGVFFSSSNTCTINWSFYDVVIYFDLGKEAYGHFFLPDREPDGQPWIPPACAQICVLRDCLSVCYENMKTRCWFVWQMKKYGNSQTWTKLATIPFHPQQLPYSNKALTLQPLYISESDMLLAISTYSTIVLCNLNDGSINFPVMDRSFSQSIGCNNRMAYIYHESLVSPNGLQSNSAIMLRCFTDRKPKPKLKLSFTW